MNHICKAASFALHKIGAICPLVSRLDFCNGILYGLPDNEIQNLQRIQNSVARLVTRTRLPVKQRIDFKILTLVFLCMQGLGPDYLQQLITKYWPARNLRPQSKSLLLSPSISTNYYSARSFQLAAAELWNKSS